MKTIKAKLATGMVTIMLLMMAAVGVAVAADSITGTITAKGDMIVLDAADGSYVLEGNDMAPDMVGKTVKVTGTVTEKEDVKVINVLSMEEVKE